MCLSECWLFTFCWSTFSSSKSVKTNKENDCTRFSLLWKAKWNENVSRKQKTKHFISIEYHTRNCRSCPLGFPVDTGKNGAQETLTYLIISMSILIVSMYGICATCADMLLSSLLKSKKIKYKKDYLFTARTFASKARTMSFTFGTLSMLILLSLLCLNYSSICKGVYHRSIELTAPYDVDISIMNSLLTILTNIFVW